MYAYKLFPPKSTALCVDFGIDDVGKRILIVRATHVGKAAGRDFRNHLRSFISFLDFKLCLADLDAWMRSAVKTVES